MPGLSVRSGKLGRVPVALKAEDLSGPAAKVYGLDFDFSRPMEAEVRDHCYLHPTCNVL